MYTSEKKHKRPDRKGGGGVNPYGQPDRKISSFFYDFPIIDVQNTDFVVFTLPLTLEGHSAGSILYVGCISSVRYNIYLQIIMMTNIQVKQEKTLSDAQRTQDLNNQKHRHRRNVTSHHSFSLL